LKAKYIVAVTVMATIMMLVLFTSISSLPNGDGQVDTTSKSNWLQLAKNAWEYFQPGKGVNEITGLHSANLYYPYFTDWDLGGYLQTIIDAEKLGIVNNDGDWGARARIEKILTFLENRELTADGLPYWWYEAATGQKQGDGAPDLIDTGKLLVALKNLELYRPDLAERVDNVVYKRVNYTSWLPSVESMAGSTSIYAYYVASGFAGFWPERIAPVAEVILNNIVIVPKVETYGVKLPMADIPCDPLFYSVFELKPDARLLSLSMQVYLAHEARYKTTGKFVAFSEGNTDLDDPSYVYEWVVRSDGRTWVVTDQTGSETQISQIVYYKVALGFLAIYNTDFARNMQEYLANQLPQPTSGYIDGIAEDGRLVSTITDKTNGLIISAARYATEKAAENKSVSALSWPWPFIQGGVANNTAVVLGNSKPHGPVGAAQTLDNLGGMYIAERLARQSSSGTLKAATDDSLASYDPSSGNITLRDNSTNLVVVGNPGINLLSYYYNDLTGPLGDPLVPVLFKTNSTGGYNYMYVPSSGSIYKLEFDNHGGLVADYGVIMILQDQPGRYVALVYGLGSEGTLAACEVLRDYNQWNLQGSAVVLKWSEATGQISIVEAVP
jgi:hypothetical protein